MTRKREPAGKCKARGCNEDIVYGNKSGFCRRCANTNEAKASKITVAPAPWEETA